ncbi:hypothetical protein QYM36_004167 [Artemia franciscana]|uniref:Uncharacterized protein n=1 Tax=Artemia franciscana TaxID=6661 RepID=A0AA88HXW4_ARTSF|nr:hypothetical protein QYM36_004167 [Artemia franciscana]
MIKKVSYPTYRMNAVVVVEKPDKSLWVYIDPHGLNKAIKISHHPIPTFHEAMKYCGAKFFIKWILAMDAGLSSLMRIISINYGQHTIWSIQVQTHAVQSNLSTGRIP